MDKQKRQSSSTLSSWQVKRPSPSELLLFFLLIIVMIMIIIITILQFWQPMHGRKLFYTPNVADRTNKRPLSSNALYCKYICERLRNWSHLPPFQLLGNFPKIYIYERASSFSVWQLVPSAVTLREFWWRGPECFTQDLCFPFIYAFVGTSSSST